VKKIWSTGAGDGMGRRNFHATCFRGWHHLCRRPKGRITPLVRRKAQDLGIKIWHFWRASVGESFWSWHLDGTVLALMLQMEAS
jgi:hypothetical protein